MHIIEWLSASTKLIRSMTIFFYYEFVLRVLILKMLYLKKRARVRWIRQKNRWQTKSFTPACVDKPFPTGKPKTRIIFKTKCVTIISRRYPLTFRNAFPLVHHKYGDIVCSVSVTESRRFPSTLNALCIHISTTPTWPKFEVYYSNHNPSLQITY